jgi:PAS domain S-box-containing protein
MLDNLTRWARARMAPATWQRLSEARSATTQTIHQATDSTRRWVSIGSDHVTSMRSARVELWRLVVSALVVLAPALVLFGLDVGMSDTIPVLLLIVCVGLSTYVADWVGGVTATVISIICLDLLFIRDDLEFDAHTAWNPLITSLTFLVVSGITIATIEHLKYDRASARLESAALRAANTALSAVEIAAARRPAGDREAYLAVLQSILTAMVRVNRASAGALYLLDPPTATLIRAAAYGDAELDDATPGEAKAASIVVGEGFAGRIALERRPIIVPDSHLEQDVDDILATNTHLRAAAGVPLIGTNDQLVGVAWVGLYVPYRFAPTAIARLNALAHRTIAFMEAARLADDQDALLDRVQDHHRRLQAVIQTIPEAVMVARPPNGQIVASNAAAQRIFSIRSDGVPDIRRADQLTIVNEPGGKSTIPMVRALEEGEVITGVELTIRMPDGQHLPVVASAAPLRADDGSIDAVVGIFQDVSPLKEAERLRDEFISVVSHELRSPLTPIRGFSQIIARDLQREGGHQQHVDWLMTLQRHVDRVTRLVDDLLDVSRLRAGRLQIRRAPADLVRSCRSVVDSRNATSDEHEVILVTDVPELVMEMDEDRIHQVLDNLVGNAVKYAPGGKVTVKLSGRNATDDVVLSVTDEGPGIPSPDQMQLFSPFYRSRSASESAVPGLGLGLYISRELVEAHGGTITVDTAPSGGAVFSVRLPYHLVQDVAKTA